MHQHPQQVPSSAYPTFLQQPYMRTPFHASHIQQPMNQNPHVYPTYTVSHTPNISVAPPTQSAQNGLSANVPSIPTNRSPQPPSGSADSIPLPFNGQAQYTHQVSALREEQNSRLSFTESQSCKAAQGSNSPTPSSIPPQGTATPLMDDMESGGPKGNEFRQDQRMFPLHRQHLTVSSHHTHQRSASSDQLSLMVNQHSKLLNASNEMRSREQTEGVLPLEQNPVRHFSNPSSVRAGVEGDGASSTVTPMDVSTTLDRMQINEFSGHALSPQSFSNSCSITPPIEQSRQHAIQNGAPANNNNALCADTYIHHNNVFRSPYSSTTTSATASSDGGFSRSSAHYPLPPPMQRPGPQVLSQPVWQPPQPPVAASVPPSMTARQPISTNSTWNNTASLSNYSSSVITPATVPSVPPTAGSRVMPPQPINATQGLPDIDIPDHARVVNLLQINNALGVENLLNGPSNVALHQDLPSPTLTQHLPNKPNCDPAVISCTLNAVPSTSQLLQQSRLPLGIVLHPFRDLTNLPVIQASTIVRCRKCRTYIHPFVGMSEQGGRRWKCSVCFQINDLPDEFYYDPQSKKYGEPQRRPELRSSTVEFIASSEYTLRPPQPSVYFFLLEVTKTAVASGYLNVVCREIARHLDNMPGDERMQVGFITYANGIDFFKLNGAAPRMCVCPDLEEIFIPEPLGLVVQREEHHTNLCDLLEHLPSMYENTQQEDNCLGSALQAALKLIGPIGGRITVFNHTLPNRGVGTLKNRLAQKAEKREALLLTSTDFYKAFALECAGQQVGVDIFSIGPLYQDLASLADACRFSAGGLFRYCNISASANFGRASSGGSSDCVAESDRSRLRQDLGRYLTRKIGFEAVLRLRCTRGLSILGFFGNCFVRSTDLLSLPNVSPDVGFGIQLGIEDSLENLAMVTLQTALLYTSSQGERRIRVHTLCVPLTSNMSEVQQHANHFGIACLLGKMAVERILGAGNSGSGGGASALLSARQALVHAVIDPLHVYAKREHRSASVNQLAVPFNLRHLARLVLSLLKCEALLPGGHVASLNSVDDQVYSLECLRNFPLTRFIPYIYPSLFAIHCLPSTLPDGVSLFEEEEENSQPVDSASESGLDSNSVQKSTGEKGSKLSQIDVNMEKWLSSPDSKNLSIYRLPLSAAYLAREGVYLVDNGEYLLVIFGRDVAAQFVQQLCPSQYDNNSREDGLMGQLERVSLITSPGINLLPRVPEPINCYVRSILQWLQLHRRMGSALFMMKDSSPLRSSLFLRRLVEDRGVGSSGNPTETRRTNVDAIQNAAASCSYVEFLQMLSQAIQERK